MSFWRTLNLLTLWLRPSPLSPPHNGKLWITGLVAVVVAIGYLSFYSAELSANYDKIETENTPLLVRARHAPLERAVISTTIVAQAYAIPFISGILALVCFMTAAHRETEFQKADANQRRSRPKVKPPETQI